MHGDVVFGEIRDMSSERTSGVAWTSALPFAKRSAFGSASTCLRLEPTHCLLAGLETGRNRGVRTAMSALTSISPSTRFGRAARDAIPAALRSAASAASIRSLHRCPKARPSGDLGRQESQFETFALLCARTREAGTLRPRLLEELSRVRRSADLGRRVGNPHQ